MVALVRRRSPDFARELTNGEILSDIQWAQRSVFTFTDAYFDGVVPSSYFTAILYAGTRRAMRKESSSRLN